MSGPGEYAGTQGLGLLRLHSTYRHDLKIYASDEGRVQMTAAAFAKGLLALEVSIRSPTVLISYIPCMILIIQRVRTIIMWSLESLVTYFSTFATTQIKHYWLLVDLSLFVANV